MRPVVVEMCRRTDERGQISVLLAGLSVVVLLVVLGGVDVTAAHLARMRLYDVADAVALDAADALDESAYYTSGVSDVVTISTATVREEAADSLAARGLPIGVDSWVALPGTGSPDGRTAVVVLEGTVDVPFTGAVLGALGCTVTITVESHARAQLR